MSVSLHLVRHTRVAVPAGICYGVADVPTAETFGEELEEIKVRTTGIVADKCYCSPLSRCLRLAIELAEVVIPDERLKELDFGLWEMMSWEDIYREEGSEAWFEDYVHVPTAGGESYQMLENRVRDFLGEQENGSHILVVTHAGPIRACLSLLTEMTVAEAYERSIGYGEVIHIEYEPKDIENNK